MGPCLCFKNCSCTPSSFLGLRWSQSWYSGTSWFWSAGKQSPSLCLCRGDPVTPSPLFCLEGDRRMREKVLSFHQENVRSSYRTVKSKKDKIIKGLPPVSNICFPSDIFRQVAYLKIGNNVHTCTVTSSCRVWLCVYALHNKQTEFWNKQLQ